MPDNPPAPPSPPAPPDPNAAIKAETDRLNAQAALEKARGERIKALGLPSFEGKTTLKDGAGAIEGLILATDALFDAATLIAEAAVSVRRPDGSIHRGPFIVLAGDEPIDFGLAASIRVEIDAFKALFQTLAPADTRALERAVTGTSIAALGALAGLLRTDTEITGLDFTQLSHRPLATATAGRLGPRAILPGAAIGRLDDNRLAGDLMGLAAERDRVAAANPDDPKVAPTLVRFDTFLVRVLTPDAAGQVPVARAGRLEQLLDEDPLVLRVFVEKAGGSLVVRKNLLTTLFWKDPVRVSAGLVVSYTVTDPSTGSALAAGVFNCRTGEAKLGDIQRGELSSSSRITASSRDDRHTLRFEARSTFNVATGKMTMANTNAQRATTAIEAWVREHRREDIAIWRSRVPSTHFGMPELSWRDVGRSIIRAFNEVEPVVATIDPTGNAVDNALRNLHARPLGEFHQFIANAADAAPRAAGSQAVEDGKDGQ